jgi:hypothetical protein
MIKIEYNLHSDIKTHFVTRKNTKTLYFYWQFVENNVSTLAHFKITPLVVKKEKYQQM